MITKLNSKLIQSICAQQVVTDPIACLKQLIENSIDAFSKNIRILVQDYGKTKIQVMDDGIGISEQQLKNIAEKGATSKITQFQDLQKLMSLGFRGQALNSISKISQLQIWSRPKNTPNGIRLNLSNKIEQKRQMQIGTKIVISKLFHNIPVRQKYFIQNCKDYLSKIIDMLKQYSLIYLQAKFLLIHVNKNISTSKNQILFDSGMCLGFTKENWLKRIQIVLGSKISTNLTYFNEQEFQGWISNVILSGSTKQNWIRRNVSYCYINKRPVNLLRQIAILLDQIYKQFNADNKYVCIVNFKVDTKSLDINISPNKRDFYYKYQKQLNNQFKTKVTQILQKNKSKIKSLENYMDIQTKSSKTMGNIQTKNRLSDEVKKQLNKTTLNKSVAQRLSLAIKTTQPIKQIDRCKSQCKTKKNMQIISSKIQIQKQTIITYKNDEISIQSQQINSISSKMIQNKKQQIKKQNDNIQINEVKNKQIIIQEDLFKIENFVKSNFSQIQIIGQFNLGFILGLFQGHFYLIDQHAADQKHNYQKLMKIPNKKIYTQQIKTITNLQYLKIQQYQQELKKFGFQFQIQSYNQIKFLNFPVILDITFGVKQFFQILDNLQTTNLKKYPPIIKQAASKACRMSTMVGQKLNIKKMKQLIYQLEQLQSPWNCPHGRPTLIKASNMQDLIKTIQVKSNFDF